MIASLVARLRLLIHRVWTSGLPHVVIALLSIQGAAYLVQFAIARLVSPEDFGVVRTVEATFSLSLVIASAGIPSLAIKSVAAMTTEAMQGRLLRRLLGLVICTSAVTGVLAAAVASVSVAPRARPWVIGIAGLLIPVSIARTSINFFQALRRVRQISVVIAIGSAIGMAIVIVLVMQLGITGWLIGRYIAETLLAVAAVVMCFRYLRLPAALPSNVRWQALLTEGSAVSSSLLVRSAIDNVPVLSLGWFAVTATDVGHFGLGSLIAGALLLTPAALNSLSIAPLVKRLHEGTGAAKRLLLSLHLMTTGVTLLPVVCALIALSTLLEHFAPAYLPGIALLRVLIAVVPLRAITATSGSALLAAGRIALGLWYNVVTLSVCLTALIILVPRYGASGAATAIIVAELVSAFAFSYGAWRCVSSTQEVAPEHGIALPVLREELVE